MLLATRGKRQEARGKRQEARGKWQVACFLLGRACGKQLACQQAGRGGFNFLGQPPTGSACWLTAQVRLRWEPASAKKAGFLTQPASPKPLATSRKPLPANRSPEKSTPKAFVCNKTSATAQIFRGLGTELAKKATPMPTNPTNINTPAYWDHVYGVVEADHDRVMLGLLAAIRQATAPNHNIIEFGAGTGVCGRMLCDFCAPAEYLGTDFSGVAVRRMREKGLRAEQLAVRDLTPEHLRGKSLVVVSQVLEHLDPADVDTLLRLVTESEVRVLVITIPNNCLGPDDEPEHQDLFGPERLDEYMKPYADQWQPRKLRNITNGTAYVAVFWRKD